jgi:N-methylhydantoinase A
MRWVIGVDVGGTFTDVVGIAPDGQELLAKAATTPGDQGEGVVRGLANLAAAAHLTLAELLEQTERIVHGTTVATNALLERRGARAAMLTTEGHRDIIAMREGLKPERYDLRLPPPEPLIPRHLRIPVRERLRPDGSAEIALDPSSLAAAIRRLRAAEVEAVAVCFLHSWRDDRHERIAAAALREALPGVFITTSSEVLPRIKEYERFSTTVANAYVGPIVSRYLSGLEGRLHAAGYHGPVLVILSHGGVAPIAEAARLAAATALSGPAGGVAAAVELARRGLGQDLVTFDMGGTSTDIALVQQGGATIGQGSEIGGARIALESLEIVTLGAGGGSIAHAGAGGMLQAGPRSAGARPGPACYGAGGTAATVTDANLVLGYLDAGNFLGGARRLDLAAAREAVAEVATRFGLGLEEAALGIHALVNARMADGVRVATVRRGVDPRGSSLLAFGGAAGLHATAVARDLGMARVAVPILAAGLSAWGMLRTELRVAASRSVLSARSMPEDGEIAALLAALEAEAQNRLAAWLDGEVAVSRSAEMRYGEQVFEIDVALDGVAPTAEALREAYHARHRALFTYALPGEEVVLVGARVTASARLPAAEPPLLTPSGAGPAAWRGILLPGGAVEAPVWPLDAISVEEPVQGPALLESATTTVLLRKGDSARLDPRGWVEISLG